MLDKIKEISSKGRQASIKESASIPHLQILNEALARGVEFLQVDLYKSDANKFKIEDGKIRLPLITVPSLGSVAAEGIVNSRESGEFLSISDLKERAKINKSSIEVLRNSGVLEGLQESNQVAWF